MESGWRYTNTGSGPVRTFTGSGADPDGPADASSSRAVRPANGPIRPEPVRIDAPLIEAAPDEPLAVVAVGPAGAGRGAVVAALLGVDESALRVPEGSFLVVRHGPDVTGAAYVPGYREPHGYGNEVAGAGPALARPPRRVELTLPAPLLRRFNLVDVPDTGDLGLAGTRVLLDVVERAGALLFVISADQALAAADLDLLAQVAQGEATVFFAVTPGEGGWPEADPGPLDPGADLGPDIGYVPDGDPAPIRGT